MLFHHAYLCRISSENEDRVKDLIEELSINDVENIDIGLFGIDEARSLIKKAYIKPSVSKQRLLVIKLQSITIEAQQALLKILEEPPQSTVFVFVLTDDVRILPTLQSRLFDYRKNIPEQKLIINETFKTFSALSHKEKLLEISKRLEKSDQDWLKEIKNGLAVSLALSPTEFKPVTLSALNLVVMNLGARGASNKLLLEELTLLLPVSAEK